MTALVDPAIQQEYDQNAAARRSAGAEVAGVLRVGQEEIAERVKADQAEFAALGQRLAESTKDEPEPVRRPEDNDISANAEAYQEPDEDVPAPARPPVARPRPAAPVEEEDVPSFQWDEDPPAAAAPAPQPPRPAEPVKRERPASTRDADEDLSEHDWLE